MPIRHFSGSCENLEWPSHRIMCTVQGERQEMCQRDPSDLLKEIADEWNQSDPDGLGRYHSLKAGTVDENEDWVVEARELGETTRSKRVTLFR
jgi:hypothetical protein